MHVGYAQDTSGGQLAALFLLQRAVEQSMVGLICGTLESELRQSGLNCSKRTPRRSI